MSENDRAYYQQRAEAEIEFARKSTSPRVVKVHYDLAEAYLEKISTLETVEQGLA